MPRFFAQNLAQPTQSQPSGELPAIREHLSVTHRRDRRRSCQQSDTFYGCNPSFGSSGM